MSFFCYGQKYSVGVRAAPMISWPAFGDKEEKEFFSRKLTAGFYSGILVSFPLKHNFDFFTEAGYSQKRRTLTFNNDRWRNKSRYHFLDATLLLRKSYKFKLKENTPSFLFFNIGPEISYMISGDGAIKVGEIEYPYDMVFNKPPDGNFRNMYMNDINRFLFGLVLGVGMKAPILKSQHITTELRFVSGHTFQGNKDSSHIEILSFMDTMKTNMKVLCINVAYTFDFDVQQSRKGKSTLDKKIRKKR